MNKILILFSVVLIGCGADDTGEPVSPKDIISTEKMIPLIVDLQILESHYQRLYLRPNLYKSALDSASSFVFEKHAVTKNQFNSSFNYYAADVNVIYSIYEAALDTINFRVNQNSF